MIRSLPGWLLASLAFLALLGCSSPARDLISQLDGVPQHASEASQALLGGLSAQPLVAIGPTARPLNFSLHVPPGARPGEPLTVLVALHGMGGSGPDFSRELVEEAHRNRWVLLAPTMDYRDWRDPELVRLDGSEILPALKATLDDLPRRTGLNLNEQVLLYGFSRGGQTAHRFALFYPELCRGVVALSTGTYTLPATRVRDGAEESVLKFPYGMGDVEQYNQEPFDARELKDVNFWLAVGGRDDQPGDVPRQWDPYIGTNRVERARIFTRALTQIGARAELTVYSEVAHEITPQMRTQAMAFLSNLNQ